jgi:ParB-like chromosome segregation protein Spo0J
VNIQQSMLDPNNATIHIGIGRLGYLPLERLRPLREEVVKELMESIKEVGLLQPILVRPRGTEANLGFDIISGVHRFEAVKRLGLESIEAKVIKDKDTADNIRLMEIDENLIRADLTAAERAIHHAARQEIYERRHPETKHGATGRRHERVQSRRSGDSEAERYTAQAARATGEGERTIQKSVRRGRQLGNETLLKISHTSLDKPEELDALVKVPEEKRAELVERAAAGEKVSATGKKSKTAVGWRPKDHPARDLFSAISTLSALEEQREAEHLDYGEMFVAIDRVIKPNMVDDVMPRAIGGFAAVVKAYRAARAKTARSSPPASRDRAPQHRSRRRQAVRRPGTTRTESSAP